MAFAVTPTSGAGPYTLTADITNKDSFNYNRYALTLSFTDAVGSCPASGVATVLVSGAVNLLESGSFAHPLVVATGSCRTYTLRVRDLVTGSIVQFMNVTVNNV